MSYIVGVDVGTSKIAALVLDTESGQTVSLCETANESETTSAADKARGRSEWDADRVAELAMGCLGEAISQVDAARIKGIGITGQMHGMTLLDPEGRPVSPFIGWRDQRCQENLPGGEQSYISRMMDLAGLGGFAHTGCPPATGYMGSTLFWLAANGDSRVARSGGGAPVRACFLADYLVLKLTGEGPVTDPTNAGGSGVFDVGAGDWNKPLIGRLGIKPEIFPPVRKSCARAGGLTADAARALGLPEGISVAVGCGDNQASFAGSVRSPADSLLINIGTGAQVSAWVPKGLIVPSVDTRPHLDGGFLLVGAPLCGGLSYALLQDFFRGVGRAFFEAMGERELYEEMNRLARAVPPDADGLSCIPLFTGSRLDPTKRASFNGISPASFTPGHFARAILEGVGEQLRLYYSDMLENGVKPRKELICCGNGVRRNPLQAEILAHIFVMPARLPLSTEESAFGAALVGAVAAGEYPTLARAIQLVRYNECG